jgi:hypothetical protein
MAGASKANDIPKNAHRRDWRRGLSVAAAILLAGIGSAAVVLYSQAHWVERQILTTDNWVATVAPLPQDPVVATALSTYITTQVFNNVPVQDEIANALPPRASFLASPLASQLQSIVKQVTNRVITSDNFQNVWVAANRAAMSRLVSNARGQTQPLGARLEQKFTLDLSSIKSTLQSKLGSSADVLPTLSPKSGQTFAVAADLKAKREQIWQYVRDIDFLSAVLPFVIIASFLGVLALSRNRRKALLVISGVVIILLLLELISIKALRQSVLDQVHVASNQPAVGFIYDTLTASLKKIVYVWIIVAAIVLLGCLVAGPARWAVVLRTQLRIGHLQGTKLGAWWHRARKYVKQYRYYFGLGIGVLLLIWLAFVANINPRLVINGVLIALSLVSIVYIIAYPRGQSRVM